jgi:ribonuclease G
LGLIVRTAAVGAEEEPLKDDLAQLIQTWKGMQRAISHVEAPGILYQDLKLSQKLIRDIYSEDVSEIHCDDGNSFTALSEFLDQNIPSATAKLKHYTGTKPIFDEFGLELDLARAVSGRVALPSGGYIILEQTEALTSVDVNTGKFVGRHNARSTILQTNLEAIVLLVEQLRVRNIGGIIIVDFIDMEDPIDREIIYNKLIEELKKDRARTNVLRISELGLVQMTRKRTSESLERRFMEPCPHCEGSGRVKTSKFQALEVIREIVRISQLHSKMEIQVKARKDIIDSINNELSDVFQILILDKKIQVQFEPGSLSNEDFRQPAFEVN